MWQRTLIKKKIKMRKFGTESTHFQKSFQIDLNMEPTHRSLTFFKVRSECTSALLLI